MISIIIPTLNEETVLEKTLKNLKKITTFPFEIIISDGRSSDGTLQIAKKYTDKVVVYAEKKRQTIANARNLGAKIAHENILVFMDADVIIENPDKFFKQAIEEFNKNKELVALTVSVKVMKEAETWGDKIFFSILNISHRFNNNLLNNGMAPGEFQMIRKNAFEKTGGYNEALVASEDYDMFFRLSRIGKTKMVKNLTILHTGRRAHKIGWSKLLSQWMLNAIWVVLFKKAYSKEWEIIR